MRSTQIDTQSELNTIHCCCIMYVQCIIHCMCVCVCLYLCVCVCMCVCLRVCVCVCVCVHISVQSRIENAVFGVWCVSSCDRQSGD